MREWLRRLFAPSIFEDEEKTRAARILSSIGWIVFWAVLFLTVTRLVTGNWQSESSKVFFPGVLAIILATQVMIRAGYVRPAGVFLVVGIWFALTIQAWLASGLRDVTILAYPVVILLCALLLGWREGAVAALLSVAAIWYFAAEEGLGARQIAQDPPYSFARDLTAVFLLSSVLIYILIYRLNRSLLDARLELRERLRAEEKLQKQARYLTALHDTTFGLLDRLELNPLLESILDRVSELLETPHVGIDLLSPDGISLRQEVGKGIFKNWNGQLTSKGKGLAGLVWETERTLSANDYPTWEFRDPEAVKVGFRSVAGAPLKSGDKFLGALIVAALEEDKKMDPEQVSLLERLAALASLAIDNARLYEEARRELAERKKIEEDLRSSDERFRKVFNNNKIAVTIVTLEEGIFLEANNAFWELSGLTPEKALGHSTLEFDLWENPGDRRKFARDLLEKGSLADVEVKFTGGDKPPRSSLGYYELITIRNRLCILSMFYDISEERRAQRNLLESEERFRKVFQASPVAIVITTLDEGRILDANEAYWKLTGYDPQTSVGRTAQEIGVWDDRSKREDFIRAIMETRSTFNPDYQFVNREGRIKTTVAFNELIAFGEVEAILSMFYDVTAQKEAREALRAAETRMRAIIASIPDMIFEISKDGTYLDFMASAEVAPTLPPDQFIGRNVREILPETIADQTLFALERAIATGQVHSFEYELPFRDEVRSFEARIAAVTSESAISMVRDISQRKWVETEREKLIEELELKNAELERFTYTVSHDLKSPVITIRGFLGFLEQDALSGNLPRLQADIRRISDATDKMQSLLNELLELSRVGRLVNPPSPAPFNEIVEEAVALVQGRIQANHVQLHVQDDMDVVFVDRPRMVEALQNLIDNAAKFTRENARIEIGQDGREGDMPVFFVRDNGIGIEPVHHERIFGLFNKLDPDSEGTGVGLALVKRIIEVHKGRIWVESEPGKGTAFFFTLPPAGPES